jgi:hypothetical protein
MTRDLEIVRSVLGECDKEENHGNDTDDYDGDRFSVSEHNSVTAQGTDDGESKEIMIYI